MDVIESTPTVFISADRYKDGSVDVTTNQLDRRMVISSSCTRDDGNIAAATTCARRLLAAQKTKADTFMDSRL